VEKQGNQSMQKLLQRRNDMWSIILASFLGGGLITGGVMWKINNNTSSTEEILTAIGDLEGEFEKAQAAVVVNLTEPDLLRVPCSSEYIEKEGDLLCREMFCRMNRQGGGQNSGGGAGATEGDCSSISAAAVNTIKIETCMPYWNEGAGSDQNSQFWRCMSAFGQKP